MGDPAGVGPEICLRLLANDELRSVCTPVVFGDAAVLRAVAVRCSLPQPRTVVTTDAFAVDSRAITEPTVLDFRRVSPADFAPGQVSAAAGGAGYAYIEAAIRAALAGQVDAV